MADDALCLLWAQYAFSWSALAARLKATAVEADAAALCRRVRRTLLARVSDRDDVADATAPTVQSLRRRWRTATREERESAVRWLVELGPRRAPAVSPSTLQSSPTTTLLTQVRTSHPAMPRLAMEELIRRGRAAAPEVAAALRRMRRSSRASSALWVVVVAGEMGGLAVVDALAPLLSHASSEIAAAAARALGRIGAPALEVLQRAAGGSRRGGAAVYAYGGLALIHTDRAYGFLCTQLSRAPEHGDVVAGALARHGRLEAIPVLRSHRRAAPAWMRSAFTEAIAMLSRGARPDPVEDWRLRYRRLRRLGWGVPPSWIEIAAIVRERRRRAGKLGTPPRLATRRYLDERRHCRECGGTVWQPLGLSICAHTAAAVLELQIAVVEEFANEPVRDVWTALDVCDGVDVADLAVAEGASGAQATDLIAIARATLYWLASAGIEDLGAGVRYMKMVMHDIGGVYERQRQRDSMPPRRRRGVTFRRSSAPSSVLPQTFS